MLGRALPLTRYMVLIGVVGLLGAALVAFVLNLVETVTLCTQVLTHLLDPDLEVQEVYFIKLIDGFLVATGLLIFGVAMFELFIHDLELPHALTFTSLGQLKSSLANIIILTLAVSFLASVQEKEDPQAILIKGAGIAVVIAVLVWYARHNDGDAH